MTRILTTALLASLGWFTTASQASADYTYRINLSVPYGTGIGGLISAVGTITVDRLGTDLGSGDITNYAIAFSSPDNPSIILGPGNSAFQFDNRTLNASFSDLSFKLTYLLSSPFSLSQTASGHYGSSFDFYPTPQGAALLIVHDPTATSTSEGAYRNIGVTNSMVYLGTAVVPEPCSLELAGTAGLMGLAWTGVRRRRRDAGRIEFLRLCQHIRQFFIGIRV